MLRELGGSWRRPKDPRQVVYMLSGQMEVELCRYSKVVFWSDERK
jgi:hypothetical protein